MKRILVLVISLLVAIPLAIGIMAGLAYYTTTDQSVPAPELKILDTAIPRSGYSWQEPVFGGMLFREFSYEPIEGITLEELNDPGITITPPEGYTTNVQMMYKNEPIWSGSAEELASYQFLSNGFYKLLVECERPHDDIRGYGTVSYICSFNVLVEPRLEVSNEWVNQGDIVALRLYNLPDNAKPTATCDMGAIHFMHTGQGMMTAFVPVGHAREPYVYNINVELDGYKWEAPVRVIETSFRVESIVVEKSEDPAAPPPSIREVATAGPADYREYQEKIVPLFEAYDEEKLWSGLFTMPIKGTVSLNYGQFTYAAGADTTNALRQSGIGVEAKPESVVLAPNAGKVVFAEETANMGLVVVIEHGGGLKSLFFFLDEMDVKMGDTVEKDEKIGLAGGKGLGDKASLYYEARLGYETLDPISLFDGRSKLYHFP